MRGDCRSIHPDLEFPFVSEAVGTAARCVEGADLVISGEASVMAATAACL